MKKPTKGELHSHQGHSIVGLVNGGNTCYFNSSLQLLACSPDLVQLLLQASTPSPSALGQPLSSSNNTGPLGFALKAALGHLHGVAGHQPAAQACTSKRSQPYDPRALLAAVTNTAPQFKGKAQHDAHELLHALLDALKTEEHKLHSLLMRSPSRRGSADLTSPTSAGGAMDSSLLRTSSASMAAAIHSTSPGMGLLSGSATPLPGTSPRQLSPLAVAPPPPSVVERTYGGALASILACCSCAHTSITEEPFLDLSLPIPTITPLSHPAPAPPAAVLKSSHAARSDTASEDAMQGNTSRAAGSGMDVDSAATTSAAHPSSSGEEETTSAAAASKKQKGKKGKKHEEKAAEGEENKKGSKNKGKAKQEQGVTTGGEASGTPSKKLSAKERKRLEAEQRRQAINEKRQAKRKPHDLSDDDEGGEEDEDEEVQRQGSQGQLQSAAPPPPPPPSSSPPAVWEELEVPARIGSTQEVATDSLLKEPQPMSICTTSAVAIPSTGSQPAPAPAQNGSSGRRSSARLRRGSGGEVAGAGTRVSHGSGSGASSSGSGQSGEVTSTAASLGSLSAHSPGSGGFLAAHLVHQSSSGANGRGVTSPTSATVPAASRTSTSGFAGPAPMLSGSGSLPGRRGSAGGSSGGLPAGAEQSAAASGGGSSAGSNGAQDMTVIVGFGEPGLVPPGMVTRAKARKLSHVAGGGLSEMLKAGAGHSSAGAPTGTGSAANGSSSTDGGDVNMAAQAPALSLDVTLPQAYNSTTVVEAAEGSSSRPGAAMTTCQPSSSTAAGVSDLMQRLNGLRINTSPSKVDPATAQQHGQAGLQGRHDTPYQAAQGGHMGAPLSSRHVAELQHLQLGLLPHLYQPLTLLERQAQAAQQQQQQQGRPKAPKVLRPTHLLDCLVSFFSPEEVTWDCPRERVTAGTAGGTHTAAARTPQGGTTPTVPQAQVQPVPSLPTPFTAPQPTAQPAPGQVELQPQISMAPSGPKRVTFSEAAPVVHPIPGSVEQRGTDLEEALQGSVPFSRPARARLPQDTAQSSGQGRLQSVGERDEKDDAEDDEEVVDEVAGLLVTAHLDAWDVSRVRLGVCAGANKEGADQVLPRGQPLTLGTVSLSPVLGQVEGSSGAAEEHDDRDRSGSAQSGSKARSKSKGRKEKEVKEKGGKEKGGKKTAEKQPRLAGKQLQGVLGAVQLLLDLAAHLLQEHGVPVTARVLGRGDVSLSWSAELSQWQVVGSDPLYGPQGWVYPCPWAEDQQGGGDQQAAGAPVAGASTAAIAAVAAVAAGAQLQSQVQHPVADALMNGPAMELADLLAPRGSVTSALSTVEQLATEVMGHMAVPHTNGTHPQHHASNGHHAHHAAAHFAGSDGHMHGEGAALKHASHQHHNADLPHGEPGSEEQAMDVDQPDQGPGHSLSKAEYSRGQASPDGDDSDDDVTGTGQQEQGPSSSTGHGDVPRRSQRVAARGGSTTGHSKPGLRGGRAFPSPEPAADSSSSCLEISNSAEVGLMQDEQGRAELSHSSMSRDRVNTDVGRENNGSSRESTPDSRRSTSSDRSTNAEAEWPNRAGTQAARAHTETAAGAGVKSGGMHVSPPVHHVGSQPMDIKPGLGGAHRPTGSGGAGVGSAGASPVLGGSLKKTTSVAAPRPALKAYALKRLPPVLLLHLKRFSPDPRTGRLAKVDSHVAFDMSLNLRPFMPPVGTGGILDVQPPAKDLHYRLAAVIEHQGEMRRGHYVAYVSRPVNPAGATAHDEQGQDEAQPLAWYYVSDTDVRPVTEAAVLKAQAYILLYVRCKAALRT